MARSKSKFKKVEVQKAPKKAETKKPVKKVKALKTSKDYVQKNEKFQDLDHFWSVMAYKHQLKLSWKSSFKAHIKKMGLDSSDKYEEGLKHFLGK